MKIYGIDHAAMCLTTEIMIHRTHVSIDLGGFYKLALSDFGIIFEVK